MKLTDACESPIEVRLLEALILVGWSEASDRLHATESAGRAGISGFKCVLGNQAYEGLLFIQPSLTLDGRAYRLDFAMLPAPDEKIVIEADGHQYHERTPEQAKRDRRRDRSATLNGWTVLRFTGSEINSDMAAVLHTIGQAYGLARQRYERRILEAFFKGLRSGGAPEADVAEMEARLR